MVGLSHHWTLAHILSLEEGPRATTLPEATNWRQWLGTSSSHIVDKPQWRPPDHPTEVSQSSPRVKSSLSLLQRQRCRLSVEEQPHFVIPHYYTRTIVRRRKSSSCNLAQNFVSQLLTVLVFISTPLLLSKE
jgi:hypothetical protein